jgi:hypothetical protein
LITRTLGALLLAGVCACAPQPVIEPWYSDVNEAGDPLAGVFEGRVPCTEPGLVACEKVKIALALYRDKQTQALTTYRLARVYVSADPEGARSIATGPVATGRGTRLDPNATIVRLDEKVPAEFRSYWRVDENIFFLLDQDLAPRVGTASWSYVLNRTR